MFLTVKTIVLELCERDIIVIYNIKNEFNGIMSKDINNLIWWFMSQACSVKARNNTFAQVLVTQILFFSLTWIYFTQLYWYLKKFLNVGILHFIVCLYFSLVIYANIWITIKLCVNKNYRIARLYWRLIYYVFFPNRHKKLNKLILSL